ncbi:MAG: hypothetical protein MUC89_21780 [Acetobacteraceae bacterium]|nr:hypothetical protein [Acetobacteraceae bacterium]
MAEEAAAPARRWLQPDGTPVSCREKLKVLDENWAEVETVLREAFEDAVLMGVDPVELRRRLADLVAGLRGPGPT